MLKRKQYKEWSEAELREMRMSCGLLLKEVEREDACAWCPQPKQQRCYNAWCRKLNLPTRQRNLTKGFC